jgi:riboflavin kinase
MYHKCQSIVFAAFYHIFVLSKYILRTIDKLPASLFQSALDGITNGVYFGWAVIEQPPSTTTSTENLIIQGRNVPIKAVVNVGYSPTFEGKENKEKIVEAHLITENSPMTIPESAAFDESNVVTVDNIPIEIEGDFYGEIMRLQLIGYLRPEKKFDSFPDLIAQIHRDIGNASWALDSMPFIFSKEDEFVKDGMSNWIGSGGGDCSASWENEVW